MITKSAFHLCRKNGYSGGKSFLTFPLEIFWKKKTEHASAEEIPFLVFVGMFRKSLLPFDTP